MTTAICPEPGCPNLTKRGRCAQHARKPFARTVKYAGGRAWQRTRARIFARDGYACRIRAEGCTGAAEVVDHVLNRARGGSDDDSNLVSACRACNDTKRRQEARMGRAGQKSTTAGAEVDARPISKPVRVEKSR